MGWADYIPFIGRRDPERESQERSVRIRSILEDIRNRHELADDGQPLSEVGRYLEEMYGDPETGAGGEAATPGWRNAEQFRAATEGVDDLDRQGYMSPERFAYMQNAGRDIDFLSNVESDPEKALYYWDRSNDARSTRKSLWGPNYQRYAPLQAGVAATIMDRRSPIAKYVQNMQVMSNIVQDLAGGTPLADSMLHAHALNQLQQRAYTGENPVGTLPDARPDATPEELSREWQQNQGHLNDLQARVQPRSGQYIANRAAGRPVPRAVGDIVGIGASMADPTLLAGLADTPAAAAATAAKWTRPPMLIAPTAPRHYAGAAAGQIAREAKGEATFGGILNMLLQPLSSHTAQAWGDYLTNPYEAPGEAPDSERGSAAKEILSPSWIQSAPKMDRYIWDRR